MAETPLCAYARVREAGLLAGAGYLMTVLYKHTRQSVVRAWHEQRGPVPFTWVSTKLLLDITGRSRSQVYDDLKALERAGIIKPSTRVIERIKRGGWELPLRDCDDMSPAPGGDESEGFEVGQQSHPDAAPLDDAESPVEPPDLSALENAPQARESVPPDILGMRESVPPDKSVRPAGQESPPRRTSASARPDRNSSFNSEENINFNSAAAAESSLNQERRATSAAARPSSRPTARRPVATVDGEPAGSGQTMSHELLVELSLMYAPTTATGKTIEEQRIDPRDPAARALAERLLATPVEGLDEESARRERRERFQRVLGTLRAFAELCRKDDSKSRWWGPNMLSQQVAQGKTLSPWAMVERNVADAERAAGAAEVKAREAAARAAAVMVPTTPTSPQDAAEREAKARAAQEMAAILGGSVRFGGPTSARARGPVAETELDQERERRRGQRREARDERDEDREIQRRWQLNAALARAREAKGEPLTDDEANKIRAGFGESEGARS